jgi:iron(III) transport system permease protein
LLLLLGLVVWPLVTVLQSGFQSNGGQPTLSIMKLVLRNPIMRWGLLRALCVAVGTTALALALALPLAVLSTQVSFKGRNLLSALVLLPLVLPPFVGAIGTRFLFARFGPLTQLFGASRALGIDWLGSARLAGVVVVEALSLYPVIFLNLQAAFASVDQELERAARNLGASRLAVFRRITLPLIRPGLFAGCTLVLIWSFTELGTPLMFNVYDVTPVQIFVQLADPLNPIPYALAVIMLACSSLLYYLGRVVLGRPYLAQANKIAGSRQARPIIGVAAWLPAAPFLMVLSLALLPHLAVVLASVSKTGAWYRSVLPTEFTSAHYVAAFGDDLVKLQLTGPMLQLGAIGNSILYASLTTAVGLLLALGVAWTVSRSQLRWRGLLDGLAMIPLAVPGLVMAFGYLALSLEFKREWGDSTPAWLDLQRFPVPLLVLAYVSRRLPYLVRSVFAGFEQVPRVYELAAANLGASSVRVIRRIVVPLALASIAAGGLMAFAFSMLEVSDSLVLAQGARFFPITRAIWELSQRLGDGAHVASALGVWSMIVLAVSLGIVGRLLGRKIATLFRL